MRSQRNWNFFFFLSHRLRLRRHNVGRRPRLVDGDRDVDCGWNKAAEKAQQDRNDPVALFPALSDADHDAGDDNHRDDGANNADLDGGGGCNGSIGIVKVV